MRGPALALLAGLLGSGVAQAADFSDTLMRYRHSLANREPATLQRLGKSIVAARRANGNVRFDKHYDFSLAWGVPCSCGLSATLKGFANHVGPKGTDGSGDRTHSETLFETTLMLDLGAAASSPGGWHAGLSYQYWRDKFGSGPGASAHASVPQLQFEMRF